MAFIKNLNLRNTVLHLGGEVIPFNPEGIAEVTEEQAKELGKNNGYALLDTGLDYAGLAAYKGEGELEEMLREDKTNNTKEAIKDAKEKEDEVIEDLSDLGPVEISPANEGKTVEEDKADSKEELKDKTIKELKALLDEKKISYKVNDTKEELLALFD